MRVRFIRFSRATQVDASSDLPRCGTWRGTTQSFVFFTVFTDGWETGARTRIRNLPTLQSVEAYLRKLNEGGWLNDENHARAMKMVTGMGLIG